MPTAAVIGASTDHSKYGNKAVRAFIAAGYRVVPVNPYVREVEGLPTVASVLDYPDPIDLATVYVQPDVGVGVMDDIARKGIPEVWLNPGADGPAVVARARALGLEPILACSILGVGLSPSRF